MQDSDAVLGFQKGESETTDRRKDPLNMAKKKHLKVYNDPRFCHQWFHYMEGKVLQQDIANEDVKLHSHCMSFRI